MPEINRGRGINVTVHVIIKPNYVFSEGFFWGVGPVGPLIETATAQLFGDWWGIAYYIRFETADLLY